MTAPATTVQESILSKPRVVVSPWIVLGVLLVGEYMILLDTTIVNVAIPSLTGDLHASLDQVLWVLNGYILVFGVLLITTGRLGDILGPKTLYILGMVIFTAASLACGLARDPNYLIAFRVVQAIGAATLAPQPGTIITSMFPPEMRGKAYGLMGSVIGLAAVTGPTLGGLLVSGFSWRAVFFPNVPIGIVTLLLAALLMPEVSLRRKHRLDWVGVVLSTAGLFAGVFGLIEGQRYSWGRISNIGSLDVGPVQAGLVSIPTVFLACAVLLIAFVVWETRLEEPLLPLSLFRDRNFSVSNIMSICMTFTLLGMMFTLLIFLQSVRGLTPLEAGVAIVPNAVTLMLVSPVAGILVNRMNGKYLGIAGFLSMATGVFLLTRFASLDATGTSFTIPLILTGLGAGLITAPMITMGTHFIAPSAAGAASGFSNTTRQLGTAIGTGVVGAVLQSRLATELHTHAVSAASRLPAQVRQQFIKNFSNTSGGLNVGRGQTGASLPKGLPPAVVHQVQLVAQQVFHQSYLEAMKVALVPPIAVVLLGAIASVFLRSTRAVPAFEREEGEEVAAGEVTAGPPATSLAQASMAIAAPINAPDTMMLRFPPAALARPVPSQQAYLSYGERKYPIKDGMRLGRSANNDVVVEDPRASRSHAQILIRNGQVMVRDLNSSNGTLVDGHRIDRDQPLHDGDTITIVQSEYVYHAAPALGRPRLVTVGNGAREEFAVTHPLTLGRLVSNDIVIRDPRASRIHAKVSIDNGQPTLKDLESLNGTRVNGELVHGEYPLHEGDVIAVGNTAFIYRQREEKSA